MEGGQEHPSRSAPDRIRVLYVDHTPIMGGAQISLLELVQTLDRSRFDLAVACTDRCPAVMKGIEDAGGDALVVRVPRLRGNPLTLPVRCAAGISDLVGACREFRPDVVHSNSARTHVYGLVAARISGAKSVWTLRDMEFPRAFFRRLVGFTAGVICVSGAVRDHYDPGHRFAGVHMIPNGILVPPLHVPHERRRVRAQLGIPEDVPVAGSVGRMLPWKGQDRFLLAAASVLRELPDARFVLLGNPDQPDYLRGLKELADATGVGERAIFGGFREDIIPSITAFDLLCHTSLAPEPFGRVLVEAMAVGVPVIASPTGGPLDIIEHEVSGLLVDPQDTSLLAESMIRLLTDSVLRERLARSARSAFETKFDQARETASVEAVYESVMMCGLGDRCG